MAGCYKLLGGRILCSFFLLNIYLFIYLFIIYLFIYLFDCARS